MTDGLLSDTMFLSAECFHFSAVSANLHPTCLAAFLCFFFALFLLSCCEKSNCAKMQNLSAETQQVVQMAASFLFSYLPFHI